MENQLRRRITKTTVAAASPADREFVIRDTEIQGFGLRVRPSGAKSFVFIYRSSGGRRGKVRRITIKGDNPEVARREAKQLAAQHHGGADPAEQKTAERKKAAALTVGAMLDRFIADHAKAELKPKTSSEYERIVEKLLKPRLGNIAIDAIGTKDVAEAYQAMREKPTQAAAAVRVLSSAMSMAEEWGLRASGSNPARIRLRGTRRRERLFADAEVARLRKAIDLLEKKGVNSGAQSLGLRLLFATGCRASEITGMEWSGVDLAEGLLRWRDSKTDALEKPMTREARALLERAHRDRIVGVPFVCPGANGGQMRIEVLEASFERVLAHARVPANENATLHLVRHWFASKTYSDAAIPLPIAMKIVGHTAVATAMRYSHVERDQVKQAADAAADRRAKAVKAAGRRGRLLRIAQ